MIRNRDIFERSELRHVALRILEAGLAAVDTSRAVRERVSLRDGVVRVDTDTLPLGAGGLYVVALGKCAVPAASALEDVLGARLTGGIVLGTDEAAEFGKLRYFRGTHPFPSRENETASEAIISLLEGLSADDRVIFIISGGGSALLYDSRELSPADEAAMLQALFKAGATIETINTLRKHTSRARGGNLAAYAYPAKSISLIFSDVPSNILHFVSSGPTVRDETTRADALGVLETYRLQKWCGADARCLFETPKDEQYFRSAHAMLFVSNETALEAMRREAEAAGFRAEVRDAHMTGEARERGISIAHALHEAESRSAFLYGGETTVTVRGDGEGGRNRELVLGALPALRDGELVAALASDGSDNGVHAGALGDALTNKRAGERELDADTYLSRNDSHHFFEAVGDAILTGPTGINISDITIALKE